ncbi:hypothetical protein SAMN05421676_102329 [Salinibacillus kushneri]|uniref:Uncharacterized protein n=1 Tax=Salinibacillus kushneri TaxID=237682 RepID=A0A1I0B228_9BACI|nr:hypothetical protein [Salinibacillus kushneri]SET00802.1 hypothetical protein SAMN05421676_102329 [Salinibacillus kushneri]
MNFEDQFLPEDIERAKQERACGIYLIEPMKLEFEYGNFESVEYFYQDLKKTLNTLNYMRNNKIISDREKHQVMVKAVPLNPLTMQHILRMKGKNGYE